MHCLFAVSSRFVQRASLTVNIDLSDVTNRYYTVLYRTAVVYEKTSFPTGTVGPRVGIFLSPLNTNDGFYLSPTYTEPGFGKTSKFTRGAAMILSGIKRDLMQQSNCLIINTVMIYNYGFPCSCTTMGQSPDSMATLT